METSETELKATLDYSSVPMIRELLAYFQSSSLRADPAAFRRRIEDYIEGRVDVPEATTATVNQNRHLVRFCWGHDHDFGTFQTAGEMGTRHIWMLSRFFDHFGIKPGDLAGKDVLDAGCWTGGVSLVLNRLGARVTAIDEIRKYTHALSFLADSFGLQSFAVEARSIYQLDSRFDQKFDVIFCLGVVYHLSDPIVGLRRLYRALKPGGLLCVESMSIDNEGCVCEYEGPSCRRGDFGWNWFVPSPRALSRWLEDTGFIEVRVGDGLVPFQVTRQGDPMGPNRCFAVGRKNPQHEMCVAGLSAVV